MRSVAHIGRPSAECYVLGCTVFGQLSSEGIERGIRPSSRSFFSVVTICVAGLKRMTLPLFVRMSLGSWSSVSLDIIFRLAVVL